MSFAVYLKEVVGLRGKFDRIAKLTFRGKSKYSIVYEFSSEPLWEQEFDWDLQGKSITATDSIEIQIMNYSRLFRHRLVGRFHMFLKRLLDEPYLSLTDFLVDKNSTVLRSTITFETMVSDEFPRELAFGSFHPVEEVERVYDDWELQSVRTSRGGSRYTTLKSKLGSIFSTKESKAADSKLYALLEEGGVPSQIGEEMPVAPPGKKEKGPKEPKPIKEKFNLHPKVRVDLKPVRESIDFNVQLRIVEAVSLAGTQLDPVCDITCFGETKSTQVKEQTNTPFWDEFFVFDTTGQPKLIFDELVIFRIYTGRQYMLKGTMVGFYKIDIGTIYHNTDHRFLGKFACLTNPDEILGASGAGIKGYLKIDITVLATGDPIKEPPNTKENTDVEENPLLPEGVKQERLRTRICIRIYKAEGLPKMNSAILAKFRKHFSGEPRIRDLADPFLKVEWGGIIASTTVRFKSYDPEWNEEIVFCDLFPTICRRLKVSLMDKDTRGDDIISTCWIDLSEISNDGCNVNKYSLSTGGFMPTFGPAWVNLYGSTRDYSFIDQNSFLNQGLEEGVGYRGRLLFQVANEEGESAHDEEISNINVKGTSPVSNAIGGKEDTYQLFCCIYEATLIDRKTAKNPVRFEMNIGNFGNTIDGKLVSWKEDDDEEEEGEDKFVHPLTPPMEAVTLDREYYNLPYNEKKPCVAIRFLLEDQRRRLYIQNILHKLLENLEDAMEDVTDKLAIDAEDTFDFLRDALIGFIEYSKKVATQLGGKITGPKAGRTKLDKDRLALCISEVNVIKEEAEELLSGLTDNSRINSNYNKVLGFRDRIRKLMKEPQESTPDVIIWLISGNKRHSYIRIPAYKIIYSTVEHECGRDSGKMQTYFLSLPGKSGLGEKGWAIQCKLQCLIWLGLLKNKKDMLKHLPLGFIKPPRIDKSTAPPPNELVYSESHKYQLRAHLYQARGLIGSDDSGLSDSFARILFMDRAADTKVIWETRSPTWNQTLMFHDLVIWGESDVIKTNPPLIVMEIFDFDDGGDIEFIGRAMSRPLVMLIDDPYEKPFFPPKLEWFDIFRGANPAGEILGAFEMFEQPDVEGTPCNIPEPPIEIEDEETGGTLFLVPNDIRPQMERHRIECLFWGVREMKKINFQSVDRPRVEVDCVGETVISTLIESAKVNPNFSEPWSYFDLDLPEEDRYCPPLTITVKDRRMFGKEILVGTSIVSSLLKYLVNSEDFLEGYGGEEEETEEGAEQPADEATDETNDEGKVNEGFEGDDAQSNTGSKRGSKISKAGSKVSKTGSRVSKTSSKALSQVGSQRISGTGQSVVGSKRGLKPASNLSKKNGSIAPSVKSVSFVDTKKPSVAGSRVSRGRTSIAGSQSSQIRYHIRSTTGTPVQRQISKRSNSRNGSIAVSERENLSTIEKIQTPIKSIGSKIVTPIASIIGSQARSRTSKRSRKSKNDLNAEDELELGAEAADYFPDEEKTEGKDEGIENEETEEGKEEKADEVAKCEGEGEGEGEAQDEGEGDVGAQAETPPAVEEVEAEKDDEEEQGAKIIMVGEDELKAEMAALEAEAEEDGDEEEEEKDGEEEGEDQVDWWSRFYETIKDEQRGAEERKQAMNGKKEEPEEGEEEGEEPPPAKVTKIINPKIIRLKVYKTELEEVLAFDGFNDILHSFNLLRGKSTGNDDEDESRICGKFKGNFRVWKYPLPPLFEIATLTTGSFKRLPTQDTQTILCRVYVVKCIDLHPTDMDGKADPYIRIKIGKQSVSDRNNFVPKQLNPNFGKSFDFEVNIPHDNMLTVGIYDYDLVGKDELIGETKIDIENRFFTKHRATCGMSLRYHLQGYNKWRDPIKPSTILQHLCKDYKLDGPHFQPGKCRIQKWIFCAPDTILDDSGNPKQSDEPSALKALHNFQMVEGKGFPLVPEHVETRSLLSPAQPGIEQGRVQMWVDLFGIGGPSPGPPIDITPRKPTGFELRCIIWNTEDVVLNDINVLTGNPCADIYVKGWIDGIKGNKQCTDVHNSSLTGEGNFNWRFIFPFKFHKAEEKVVITKKPTLFCWVATEEKVPARLILQCWDSDALSTDDFLGDLMLNLVDMPAPAKTSVQCTLDTMSGDKKLDIFKKKLIKGWWPFILRAEDAEPELVGKVEAELELLTEVEAEEDPAGLGRKEPNPLDFPNRPDVGMTWMMNPLTALKNFLWAQYKYCLAKFAILAIIFAVMGLFLYKSPDHVTKKLFGG